MIKKLWSSLYGQRDYWLITICVLYATAIAAVFFRNTLFSVSVDLAHHTALAEALRHSLAPMPSMEPFLGEMYIYPTLSHRLAAALINFGADPINALVVPAAAAAVASWLLVLYLTTRSSRTGLVIFSTLSVASILTWGRGAFVGFEIVNNFFYAQIVGDCVSVLAVILAVFLLNRRGTLGALWFCLIAAFTIGLIHLLSGVRFVVAADLAFALAAYRRYRAQRTFDIPALSAVVLLPVSLYFNPSYAAMKHIAENNGALSFGFPAPPLIVLLLAVSVCVVALVGLVREDSVQRGIGPGRSLTSAETGSEARVIIFLLAAASAIGAIVQFAALTRGLGSDYAVKKHVFGTLTFGLAAFSLLMAQGIDKVAGAPTVKGSFWGAAAVILPAHMLIILSIFVRPNVIDVPVNISIARDVAAVKEAFDHEQQRGHPIFISASLPPTMNYYETVAILNAPRGENTMNLLSSSQIQTLGSISHILTLRGDPRYDLRSCREASSRDFIVVIDPRCYQTHRFDVGALSLGSQIEFKEGTFNSIYLTAGWSALEATGVWSDGDVAVAHLPLTAEAAATEPLSLVLDLKAFVPPQSPVRNAEIRVNGGLPTAIAFDAAHPQKRLTLSVPKGTLKALHGLDIQVHNLNPISPSELHLGADGRRLGVGLVSLEVRGQQ